jgi:hypothetical protein
MAIIVEVMAMVMAGSRGSSCSGKCQGSALLMQLGG